MLSLIMLKNHVKSVMNCITWIYRKLFLYDKENLYLPLGIGKISHWCVNWLYQWFMDLVNCLTPKLIRDNDGLQRYVACGHCSVCLKRRASRWVARLDAERKCWKYAIFFTLTYDDLHLPFLTDVGKYFSDLSNQHVPSGTPSLCIDKDDLTNCYGCTDLKLKAFYSWLHRNNNKIPYLSSYDVQCFIKRLRTYSQREFAKIKNDDKNIFSEKSVNFRYFVCGEYGETTLRPHYHGLIFTNSEFLANRFRDLLYKSWKFGITDFSFVSGSNSSYVSSYLNSYDTLPLVYQLPKVRPFVLCSKNPPLGTLLFSTNFIKNVFFSCSPQMVVTNTKKGLFENVSLWRCLVDRLYPKLTLFDKLSFCELVKLYKVADGKSVGTAKSFLNWCLSDTFKIARGSFINDYIDYLRSNCDDLNQALLRWYYISSRVIRQADSFDISVSDYVRYIRSFYNNVSNSKLKAQYEEFNNVLTNRPHEWTSLLLSDKLFIDSVLDVPFNEVTYDEVMQLQTYGVDLEKFLNSDESVRLSYREYLRNMLQLKIDDYKIDADDFLNKKFRTKFKNDYLASNAELQHKLYTENLQLITQLNEF